MARTTRTALALATTLALTASAAGCSKVAESSATLSTLPSSSSTTTATPTATKVPSPLDSLPDDIEPLVKKLYAGGAVPTTLSARATVDKRTPKTPAATAKVAATRGTWKKTPVSVVKVGDDVTMLVKGPSGWAVVGGWWPSLKAAGPAVGPKRFVSLMGIDRRPWEKDNEVRSDSLHIVGYDGKDGAAMLGMARDTWVTLPSGRQAKINDAFDGPGAPGMVAALEKQVGVDISNYAYVDFDRFKALIKEFGGITVYNPRAFNVGAKHFAQGRIRLTPVEALAFARERHALPNSDKDRSANQGWIIIGGAILASGRGPLGLPELMTKIDKHVTSDMTAEQAILFFSLPYVVDISKVGNKVSFGSYGTASNGASVIFAGPRERALYADFRDARFDGK